MKPPRILFVKAYHISQQTGGAEEQCWLLATEIARRGWDVHYASQMSTLPDPPIIEGVHMHAFPTDASWLDGNRAAIRQVVRELDPDVLYVRSFDLYAAHSILSAPRHTKVIWAPAKDADGFVWQRMHELWRLNPAKLYFKRAPIWFYILWMAWRGTRRANITFAQRSDMYERFRRMGRDAVLVRNVQPPVPETEIQSHEGTPTVLWVGSIKRWKRPELFIELARRCRNMNAEFRLIGGVQEASYEAVLKSAVQELPNFHYDGPVPLTHVPEQYARAHLVLCTSITEGYPNTFIHAWLHGVPVASLNIDPEGLVTRLDLGRVAADMDALEQAVRELLADPAKRREIGARARAFASEEHDLSRIMDRVHEILAERGVRLPQ